MGSDITKEIAYWTESVACFDPEKVLDKLVEAFPQVEIDPIDYAEEELNRFRQFAREHIESEETRLTMLSQITGKARRNGPVYHFHLSSEGDVAIRGYVARYRVGFKSDHVIDASIQEQIIAFLNSLDLGTLNINNVPKSDKQ